MRAPYQRRETPWPKRTSDSYHDVTWPQKNNVDGKSHEQGMHPHKAKGLGLEQHSLISAKLSSAQQPATAPLEAACEFCSRAKHSAARLIAHTKNHRTTQGCKRVRLLCQVARHPTTRLPGFLADIIIGSPPRARSS